MPTIQGSKRHPDEGKALHLELQRKYGTVLEAARRLGISANSLYYHFGRGTLPACLAWRRTKRGRRLIEKKQAG